MARLIAPRKVYRLISGVFDDNTGREYKPNDEIITNRNIMDDPNVKVKYLGLFQTDGSCCGGKIYLPEERVYDHLELQHRGGGRYCVVNKLTEQKIHDGWLTKEEAEEIEASNEEKKEEA